MRISSPEEEGRRQIGQTLVVMCGSKISRVSERIKIKKYKRESII